jgi:hypothetical protein
MGRGAVPQPSTLTAQPECYAGDGVALADCTRCGQPFCNRHGGEAPRLDWCAECVANAKLENALDWTTSGCLLGAIGGIVLFVLLLLVAYPLTQGPGRGFVIVAACSLLGGTVTFILRRLSLR